jgi:hypothetical protein
MAKSFLDILPHDIIADILGVSVKEIEEAIDSIECIIKTSIDKLCTDNDIDADIFVENCMIQSQKMKSIYNMNRNISDVAIFHKEVVVIAINYDFYSDDTLHASETMAYPSHMDLFKKFIEISDVCGYSLNHKLNGFAIVDMEKVKNEKFSQLDIDSTNKVYVRLIYSNVDEEHSDCERYSYSFLNYE